MNQAEIDQYEADIRQGEAANPATPAEEIAAAVLSSMTAKQRRELLLMVLTKDIERARIARLKEEARLQHQREVSEGRAAYYKAEQDREAREHADDPWNAKGRLFDEWNAQPSDVKAAQRAAVDEEFAKFLASRPSTARALQFSRYGCDEFSYWKKDQAQKAFEAKIRRKVKLELTKELLTTRFTGSTGTLISWGNATADDHLHHMRTLLEQAGDTAVVAKKHAAAIDLLTKHQVGTLNEVRKATTKKKAA